MLSFLSKLFNPCSLLNTIIISLLFRYSSDDNYLKLPKLFHREPQEYDFIIVGAGSAGCVVANRLSENSEWKVLLLEEGKEEPLITGVPSYTTKLQKSKIDWNYHTQKDENACLIGNGCAWPSGKVMGGSSSINIMQYVRGNKEDFNTWAKLGNPGWSYDDVLSYFIKSENNKDPDIVNENPEYHGTKGYLSVERFPYVDPNSKILYEALQELGYKPTDINAKHQLGTMMIQTTSNNGSRASTNSAFIRPIRNHRSNLFIKTQVYVTKVLIDSKSKRAIGVEYAHSIHGPTRKVMAKKEVILSAGVVQSPKLLMLSGIGPSEQLEKHQINVIKNLSVGHNLHDHVTFVGLIGNVGKNLTNKPNCLRKIKDLYQYFSKQNGPLASIGVAGVAAFFQTSYEQTESTPDIQLVFLAIGDVLTYYEKFVLGPILLTPRSRGFIRLNDTEPIWGNPIINPRYFDDKMDMKRMIEGVRMSLKLFNTTVLKENGFELDKTPLQPCNKLEFNSDVYWDCVARQYTQTLYHTVGSCKMGPKEDTEAVVDAKLRVYGIDGLRVIDASIMPNVPRGNTNAATIMIGEKGSDMIIQNWTSK
ncbi:glucose dehydrogenase [FAD, quinone]-like [Leptopilina boulardi]|uniref:glucose dehydrogenase [FAD, quinone]-like n=1 Tax=Leptopilina boulardi TaxID=63433 RepID=UPI0021F55A3C|nr:glucose dehydrogenase [FAD, quinone]-like [Leptopilina boulardi]